MEYYEVYTRQTVSVNAITVYADTVSRLLEFAVELKLGELKRPRYPIVMLA